MTVAGGRRPHRLRGARRLAAVIVVLLGAALPLGAQEAAAARPAVVRDAGPGPAGRLLRALLAAPHALLAPDSAIVVLPTDSAYATTLVIVAAEAFVASRVDGDVAVVGGDLYLRPGAVIRGRAIAIGGGVYGSTLARVGGGELAFRDLTFDATRGPEGMALTYRSLAGDPSPWLTWPGVYGLRVPTYSRVDGLAIGGGPRLGFRDGGIAIEPTLTYRSHLGSLDPAAVARLRLDGRTEAELRLGRGTFTNDGWARWEPVNAAATIATGDDERNWYRADRVQLGVARRFESFDGSVTPWIGAQTEDAWSAGPQPGSWSAPWSARGRRDTLRMLRPNPRVLDGRITSALAGARADWDDGDLLASGSATVEAPVATPDDRRFAQLTVDARAAFPVLRTHRLEVAAHTVLTVGDVAPPQRWAYLGGGGTIPTVRELALGGDQLLFLEGAYLVPLPWPQLPFVGMPAVGPRYIAGAAGVGRLPAFVQNVGLRVAVQPLRLDLLVDPATGRTAIGFGVDILP